MLKVREGIRNPVHRLDFDDGRSSSEVPHQIQFSSDAERSGFNHEVIYVDLRQGLETEPVENPQCRPQMTGRFRRRNPAIHGADEIGVKRRAVHLVVAPRVHRHPMAKHRGGRYGIKVSHQNLQQAVVGLSILDESTDLSQ